jgi:hypothetical protein
VSGRRDPDLEDLFDQDPGLERYANLLRSARLKPPPLDPGFRPALRRRLMHKAYDRYQEQGRLGFLSRLFNGPAFAATAAVAGIVLIAALFVANAGNFFGTGPVQVTTVGSVAVDQPILVSFSQPMNHQSVEQSIQIEPATQVTYSWQGNNLVIQPASGELAPNTQYHVTVAADAKTAPGVKIGQPAVVAVTTAALSSPVPSPSPSPSPPAPPQITAERSLSGPASRIAGWSADGKTLLFIDVASLKSINADGTGLKTIQTGVKLASVAPAGAALAYVTDGGDPKLYLAGLDGSAAQVADGRDVTAIGWQNGKPLVVFQADVGPAGATPQAKLPNPAACLFSPDATKLICATLSQATETSPKVGTTFLFDIASQKSTSWTGFAQRFAWSPDGTRLAYWRDGATFVGAPDGSPGIEILKSIAPNWLSWSPDGKLLLLAGPDGSSIVKADGTGLHQLSQAAFQDPLWAPVGSRFAFVRSDSLWVDDVAVAGNSLDLGAAGEVVSQYEQARIKNDAASAGALLGPSASPVAPSPLSPDLHLGRSFVISSQATAKDVRFTVRLIFSRGANEVRYQDESLVLVGAGTGFKIDSITDSSPRDLGKGPTVNSAAVQDGGVVVVFDSDLDQLSVIGSVGLTGADGKPVALTTSYAGRKLTVIAHLNPGAKYRLTVSNAVKDIAGQPLQDGYEYDFVAVAPVPSPTPSP